MNKSVPAITSKQRCRGNHPRPRMASWAEASTTRRRSKPLRSWRPLHQPRIHLVSSHKQSLSKRSFITSDWRQWTSLQHQTPKDWTFQSKKYHWQQSNVPIHQRWEMKANFSVAWTQKRHETQQKILIKCSMANHLLRNSSAIQISRSRPISSKIVPNWIELIGKLRGGALASPKDALRTMATRTCKLKNMTTI